MYSIIRQWSSQKALFSLRCFHWFKISYDHLLSHSISFSFNDSIWKILFQYCQWCPIMIVDCYFGSEFFSLESFFLFFFNSLTQRNSLKGFPSNLHVIEFQWENKNSSLSVWCIKLFSSAGLTSENLLKKNTNVCHEKCCWG